MTILSAKNLESFYGPVPALRGVSVDICKGTVTAVIGANGAGKSTLLNTLSGLLEARFGHIEFLGERIEMLSADQVASRGLVLAPEGRQVFPEMSVRDNLRLGAFRKDARAHEERNLARVLAYFPRLEQRFEQRAGMMSGGEQQMLAIARALMAAPDMLMLDEPSLGLSPKYVHEIYQILARINDETGLTVLVAEQNASVALSVAHFAYVLELGRVVLLGPAEEMATKEVLQESFLGSTNVTMDQKRFRRKKKWR
ncbi:High-affinity branched-chain amino acid transport ATP-binding protein LivF [Pseudovibrio axinellae]|uniref:High-affinity branched-chain amino acid transport ATP-binding protein LivF n=1 Tax=Pseudovibrio axinellae TaxID=989403 RepID=A0A165ZG83_9HYPH|nr:ABC transporter ATP-binding protein [Pseudovibrio axinellae]KZL19865.1 High-affinity branched-chain amino acid transport ATP-binding protein LivF [Pseudovibrio axinellae]SER38777.1 amino acid/amide ABC transporter ATP-binding protein 2, HAAT family [Pseudovibrio axinellae]